MLYIDRIKESVRNDKPLYPASLSATKEEILNADADELAYMINTRTLHTSDGKPCRCYCIDCRQKGVSLKECHVHIRETLLRECE